MRTIVIAASIGLFISACAPVTPNSFNGPNGRQAYSMQCSGFGRTMDACLKKAGEMCPNGYSVIDRGSNSVAYASATGPFMMMPKESLAVECK